MLRGDAGTNDSRELVHDGTAPVSVADRIVPDRRSLPSLLVLFAGAVIGALVVWWLAVPRGTPAPNVSITEPVTSIATEGADRTPQPSASATASVVVDVQGRVRRPGVLQLPQGSRVVDAITKAGGLTARGTTSGLNLAQVLLDGTQVLVPDRRSGTSAATGLTPSAVPTAGAVVNLNTASLEQLDTLPGIGPVLAQRILDWRTQNGSFASIEQLRDVSGIGDATFADVQSLVTV